MTRTTERWRSDGFDNQPRNQLVRHSDRPITFLGLRLMRPEEQWHVVPSERTVAKA